jgi:hypothetical protein
MVTAPVLLWYDAREHDVSDFLMKRRLAGISHTLLLTWLEVEEGKNPWNLQMNRVMFGNNDGKYTTTYCGVKTKVTPYLVCLHAGFLIQASRQGHETRLKKCT